MMRSADGRPGDVKNKREKAILAWTDSNPGLVRKIIESLLSLILCYTMKWFADYCF